MPRRQRVGPARASRAVIWRESASSIIRHPTGAKCRLPTAKKSSHRTRNLEVVGAQGLPALRFDIGQSPLPVSFFIVPLLSRPGLSTSAFNPQRHVLRCAGTSAPDGGILWQYAKREHPCLSGTPRQRHPDRCEAYRTFDPGLRPR